MITHRIRKLIRVNRIRQLSGLGPSRDSTVFVMTPPARNTGTLSTAFISTVYTTQEKRGQLKI